MAQQVFQETLLKESMMNRVRENEKLKKIGRGKDGMLTLEELEERAKETTPSEMEDLIQIRTRMNVHNIIEETRNYVPDIVKYLYDERVNKISSLLLNSSGKKIVALIGFAFMDALEDTWTRL